ncbi:MAG: hypothetical protein F4Z53_00080 [Acidimicrobiales bacterium]|nr:hypothetical protein [Acidimicrobiales bacterium]MXX41438.1 hypothetical protein [Acidimicrobiales bacterium]MYB81056.1 hypothetical protein [Acidimicrobiales bacterium]MYD34519.1 hypothetical protein [Acidimicrobiales bacterium]MYI09531.1 hypothetical protein [Acidimicrobiales bacterium]
MGTLLSQTPAMADHECHDGTRPCQVVYHGDRDRDIADWIPVRKDEAGSFDWHEASAPSARDGSRTYHYTYATGGRLLDSHAYWNFDTAHDGNRPRGVYRLLVRIPKSSDGARVPATATVHYSVWIREGGGTDRLLNTFLIDQRRQQGWVDSGLELVLKSPDRVRVTASDALAWPDYRQVDNSHAVVTVDAVKLEHHKFLPEDRTYAQLQCAAKLSDAPSGLKSGAEAAEWTTYGSFAANVGGLALGAALSAPAGIAVGAALALADPLSVWINGESLWSAIDGLRQTKERLDVTAFLGAARFGGEWERSADSWGRRRVYEFSDPGPCELLAAWERYLPPGA